MSAGSPEETATRRIRVLHLRDSPWLDGPGRTIVETASTIDRRGFDYLVGAFVRTGAPPTELVTVARDRGLDVHEIHESGPLDPRVPARILDLVRRERVDLIHAHEWRSDLIGLACARAAGVPVFTTLHGWIQNDRKGRAYVALDKLALRYMDRVITVSHRMADTVRETGVDPARIRVLNNALVLDRLVPDPTDRAFRHELGVADDHTLIANIGRLSPEKGQFDFVESSARVLRDRADARFVLVGDGPDRAGIEARIAALGVGWAVSLIGYRRDMQRLYNGVDIVVQSSFTEGMPNVVIEAMHMGKTVIATDVGGTSEILLDPGYGVLVPPARPDRLAVAILAAMADPATAARRAAAGREHVDRTYDFRLRTRRLETIYRSYFGLPEPGAAAPEPRNGIQERPATHPR